MKSYEFYVLLGKYKRRSITKPDFERLLTSVTQNREFRYAFMDSTGEREPIFSGKMKSPLSGKENTDQDFERPSYDGTFHNENFKRVRRSKKRSSKRLFLKTLLLGMKEKTWLFAGGVAVFAMISLFIFSPPKAESYGTAQTIQPQQEGETTDSVRLSVGVSSIADGSVFSEANQMLTVDVPTLETEILDVSEISVPTMGLEESIRREIDRMLVDPEAALAEFNQVGIENI